MDKIVLNVYLFFAGNCREAMEFYQSVLGGKLDLQTYDEAPGNTPDDMGDKVMHANLTGGDANLMASDVMDIGTVGNGRISLSLGGTDEAKLRNMFDRLSAGGRVDYPLKKEFWGDIFGSFTDKFGIDWMINISNQP